LPKNKEIFNESIYKEFIILQYFFELGVENFTCGPEPKYQNSF